MHPRKGRVLPARLALVAALLAFVGCGDEGDFATTNAAAPSAVRAAHVADQLLVQYGPATSEPSRQDARRRIAAVRLESLDTPASLAAGRGGLELVELHGVSVEQAIARLSTHPAVEFAEPNFIYEHQSLPNDPSFGQLWGLHNSGQTINGGVRGTVDVDIDAPEAWDVPTAEAGTGSAAVYVGVIDEGIDHRHADLAGVVINPGEDADDDGLITSADFNHVDDDGNGKVDDVHGWDFVGNDNTVYDGKGKLSIDAHGTHVSGTIGAVGDNGRGVAGVNWTVRIVSAKFLGRNGGTTANAIRAVDYLTDLRNRGVNLVATNNSWGGGGYSLALLAAIDRAGAAGILFVAAAGNGGADGIGDDIDRYPAYPAAYGSSSIIAVAAIDRLDRLTPWSNYGDVGVDVGAPGSAILSTTPNNGYSYYSGTSMATPHVTGLCALLAAYEPSLGPAAVKARVLGTVVRTAALAEKTVAGGRINAYRARANTVSVDP